jgi:hypothetical protein
MLKLRHEADASPDHFQVYSGEVRVGTIYKTSGNSSHTGQVGGSFSFSQGRRCEP